MELLKCFFDKLVQSARFIRRTSENKNITINSRSNYAAALTSPAFSSNDSLEDPSSN